MPFKMIGGGLNSTSSSRGSPFDAANALNRMMPESDEGGHQTTAAQLCSSNKSDAAIAGFKILLYQLSNKMQLSLRLEDGLHDHQIIERVKHIAETHPMWTSSLLKSEEPTVAAMLENIFASAVRSGEIQIFTQVLNSGISPDLPILGRLPEFLFSFKRGRTTIRITHTCKEYFLRPTQVAVLADNFDLLRTLLQSGADPNMPPALRMLSPLKLACRLTNHVNALAIVRLLVSHGANINRPVDMNRPTALILAVAAQNFKLMRYLVLYGADTSRVLLTGHPIPDKIIPLDLSVLLGDDSIVHELSRWKVGKRLLAEDHDALTLAVSEKHHSLVSYLKNAGAYMGRCSWGETPLVAAAFNGDFYLSQKILEWRCDNLQLYAPGFLTAMHAAACRGSSQLINFLAESGESIDAKVVCRYGFVRPNIPAIYRSYTAHECTYWHLLQSPLQVALEMGNMEAASALIRRGASLVGGEMVLAAGRGLGNIIDSLIAREENINEKWLGQRPIQSALKNNQQCIALNLVRKGAKFRGDALIQAIIWGNDELIGALLARKDFQRLQKGSQGETLLEAAFITKTAAARRRYVERLLSEGLSYESAVLCSATWSAAKNQDYLMIQKLIERRPAGDNDVFEATALGIAVQHRDRVLLGLLLSDKFSIGIRCSLVPPQGMESAAFWWRENDLVQRSLISLAVESHEIWIVEAVLKGGYEPDLECLLGSVRASPEIFRRIWTSQPLTAYDPDCRGDIFDAALESGNMTAIHDMIQHGFDIECRCTSGTRSGSTPLQSAVQLGNVEIADMLLDAGADVNAAVTSQKGKTVLQAAAFLGHVDLTQRCIGRGADIDAPGSANGGRTALEIAAEFSRIDMIQLLLDNGAGTVGPGRRQFVRAIALAERDGHYAAANLLHAHRQWDAEDEDLLTSMRSSSVL